jgi:hypothetical protein
LILEICAELNKDVDQCGFFWGEILPNFDLRNMISTYAKDFPWKKWPKFARFPIKKFQIIRFL